ncbi:MAG TPA: DUF72 domain-containing protein [Candidatus Hydrothermia bacterium]|nr:DUF72 domain-containing protein [Candidatus Hydrothermae bacterium]MDD3649363.1 DUF72 domain-containing protein [Candidatus Hydrothermia bacterium]MDD5573498.1 DUF72 domain-containing protein [Candidatus Hydrothermia bacterium]HOK22778.1 DUF72 domain-containing protein [Candidatus Hydrothermia bacterium]HOL23487.1 DUF72 domain-containing protein [Candidatus Hydrothermia bacterium]
MNVYIGTSGWRYPWNEGSSLSWYVENSNLNAVELNASFYRFPFPSQIKGWANTGRNLRWAIKVSRRITHLYRFNENAYSAWDKFKELFAPMQNLIDFFLFQLPPTITPKDIDKIEKFIEFTGLREKFALEVRNITWYQDTLLNWAQRSMITWVSVSAPGLPQDIYNLNGNVYLRMHGVTEWYAYSYSTIELEEVAEKIVGAAPERAFVFFNNDHAMLKNAQELSKIFQKKLI